MTSQVDRPNVLFSRDDYQVVESVADQSPTVAVLFQALQINPSIEAEAFGEAWIRKCGLNYVAVRCAQNDWYQELPDEAIEACRRAIGSRRAVGYSHSMGAYALLNFYHDLGLSDAILFAPQFSVDPLKVPFEQRWRNDTSRINFKKDKVATIPQIGNALLIGDHRSIDGPHIDLILEKHPIQTAYLRFADHSVPSFMLQAGFLTSYVLPELQERMQGRSSDSARKLLTLARKHRHRSSSYFVGLSKRLYECGRRKDAVVVAEKAIAANGGNDWVVHSHLANLYILTNEPYKALSLINPWLKATVKDDAKFWAGHALRAAGLANVADMVSTGN